MDEAERQELDAIIRELAAIRSVLRPGTVSFTKNQLQALVERLKRLGDE